MESARWLGRSIVASASALLVVATITLAVGEALPFFESGLAPSAKFAAIVDRNMRPGKSLMSQRMVLEDCFVALYSLVDRISPDRRRGDLRSRCLAIADQIISSNKANAFAYVVRAKVLAGSGDAGAFSAALSDARRHAPSEGWLAQMRFEWAERHRELLTEEGLAAADLDMALLAQTEAGPLSIARHYVENPAARSRITAVLETLPAKAQEKVVAALRDVARSAAKPDVDE